MRELGLKKIVMMTGTVNAQRQPLRPGQAWTSIIQRFCRKIKPGLWKRKRQQGRKVIMIGDGINDSPALSAADVGIAVSDGAQIAREIADITITADDLYQIVTLKRFKRRTDEEDSLQLPMDRGRQCRTDSSGSGRADSACHVGAVSQYFHAADQSEKHAEFAALIKEYEKRRYIRRFCRRIYRLFLLVLEYALSPGRK